MYVGSDRPALRDLYEHVVEEAAYKWRDLRVDLLPYERHAVLDIIEADGPNDVECCINVFERWLETTRDATWYQLIRALSSPNVRLNDLAFHLEQMIVREGEFYSTCRYSQVQHVAISLRSQINECTHAMSF